MQDLELSPLQKQHHASIDSLSVHDDQLKYVGTLEEILCNVSSTVHPNVVLFKGQVVGFFLIDTTYSQDYAFCQGEALGLRAYFIGKQHQGKGYGKAAMAALATYLNQRYAQAKQIYLTVNCKNPSAYQCYIAAGFEDTETLYYGGAAGPQHVLRLALA